MILNNVSDSASTHTISEFIKYKSDDELSYRNFSILEFGDGIEYFNHNLIDDYMTELENMSTEVILEDEQFKHYKYSPDLLAYDLYGTVALDFLIMKLNGMIDPREFIKQKLLLPYASQLNTFLSKVFNAESLYLSYNRAKGKTYGGIEPI